MAQLISPARMPDRKNFFCSSVPWLMIIGPTVDRVTNGNGARARWTSVKKMNWSAGRAPLAAVLDRPADPQPAVGAHLADEPAERLATLGLGVELVAYLGGEQLGEVGPELGAQSRLLRRLLEVHAGIPPLSDSPRTLGCVRRQSVDVVSAPPASGPATGPRRRRRGLVAPVGPPRPARRSRRSACHRTPQLLEARVQLPYDN